MLKADMEVGLEVCQDYCKYIITRMQDKI